MSGWYANRALKLFIIVIPGFKAEWGGGYTAQCSHASLERREIAEADAVSTGLPNDFRGLFASLRRDPIAGWRKRRPPVS